MTFGEISQLHNKISPKLISGAMSIKGPFSAISDETF